MKTRRRKYGRTVVRGITSRRLAAAKRALRRERERLALFADQLEQETPEQRITKADVALLEYEQGHRDLAAKHWRKARAVLAIMGDELREKLLKRWNASWCPPDAAYFIDFVRARLREELEPCRQQNRNPQQRKSKTNSATTSAAATIGGTRSSDFDSPRASNILPIDAAHTG